jgi:hypothetical protein
MNPWIIVGAIVAVLSFYGYGHHKGWKDRDAEMQVEIAKKNAESRQKEQELSKKVNETQVALQEANNVVTQKQSALDRAIRAGRVRFPSSCVQASPSPAAASGDRAEAPAQPNGAADEPSDAERQTLAAIAAIVADGDRAINQLNACIDAYQEVRKQINGQQ